MSPSGPNVIVVGGGILGLSLAAALADQGGPVTLVTGAADRASDASLVWLNVISTQTRSCARLRVASMQAWHDLMARDPDCPVRIKGALLWDRDAAELQALNAFQASVGWDTRIIDAREFARRAPGIAAPPVAALYAPGEAAADPAHVMTWAEHRAAALGVTFVRADVESIMQASGKARGVRLTDGTMLTADQVIIAAGAGSPPLVLPFGIDLGFRDAPGMLMRTARSIFRRGRSWPRRAWIFWQGDDGTIFLATGTHRTMTHDLEGSAAAALDLLAEMMPAAAGLTPTTLALRMRPIPGDGFPVLGPVPGAAGLWLAVAHSGMTLAPIIARTLSAEVLGLQSAHDLDPFRPDRMRAAVKQEA